MPAQTRTVQGDTADLVAWRIYGDTAMTDALLAANPGLAAHGPTLPLGLVITLPERRVETRPGYTLWE